MGWELLGRRAGCVTPRGSLARILLQHALAARTVPRLTGGQAKNRNSATPKAAIQSIDLSFIGLGPSKSPAYIVRDRRVLINCTEVNRRTEGDVARDRTHCQPAHEFVTKFLTAKLEPNRPPQRIIGLKLGTESFSPRRLRSSAHFFHGGFDKRHGTTIQTRRTSCEDGSGACEDHRQRGGGWPAADR